VGKNRLSRVAGFRGGFVGFVDIQVTSKPGNTRFQVWLPWADPSEPGEQLDSAVTLQGPEGNE
jgi:hypothetical protein